MPANKNAMTRYKILDELLSSRYHNYSIDDLTEEVSNRLCEKDSHSNGVCLLQQSRTRNSFVLHLTG